MSEVACALWCTTCGARLTAAETKGVSRCPKCGSKGVPCSPSKDYLIEINWHELRILGIWASNWADSIKDQNDGDPSEPRGSSARTCLRGILSRLERQAPNESPLTMGGELRQLRTAVADGEIPGAKIVEAIGVSDEGFAVVHGPGAVGFGKRP